MGKRKTFRRAKVWGVVPGKRLQIFSKPAPKSQALGILGKETAPGAVNTQGGKGTQQGS